MPDATGDAPTYIAECWMCGGIVFASVVRTSKWCPANCQRRKLRGKRPDAIQGDLLMGTR